MKHSVNLSSSFKLSTLAMVLVVGQGVLLSGCSSHSAMMVKQVEQQSSDQQRIQPDKRTDEQRKTIGNVEQPGVLKGPAFVFGKLFYHQ